MATFSTTTIRSTGTGTLNLAAQWLSGLPSTTVAAQWSTNATSGQALGSNVSWGALQYASPLAAGITIAAGSTLSLAGMADTVSGNTYFIDNQVSQNHTYNCAVSLGAGNGIIYSAGVLIFGSTLAKSSGILTFSGGAFVFGVANAGLTAPIEMSGGQVVVVTNALGTGTFTINGDLNINTNGATTAATVARNFTVNSGFSLHGAGNTGSLTFSGTWDFGATTRTLTFAAATSTFNNTLSGTAGFTKAGAGTMILSGASSTISGVITPSAGTLSISSTVLQNATVSPSTGTFTTAAGTTIGALAGSTNYTLASTLTVGSSAATAAANLSATYSGVLAGTQLVTKAGTGTWTLDGANTTTGGFTISAGTLLARKGGATSGSLGGTTGTITIASGATLELNGNGTDQTFTKSGAALNVSGGTIKNSANTNTLIVSSGALSTSALLLDVTGGKLVLQCAGIISGATIGLTKTGTFPLKLDTTTATFGGKVTLSAGTTEVTKLADSGTASSLGNGSGTPAIDIAAGTILSHVGTGTDSTNRVLNFTGGGTYTLDSSGTGGAVAYTGTPTFATAAANTIALTGSNTSYSNLLSGTINNQGGGNLTYITKNGTGTWGFGATATLNFTGGLTVTQGEFHFGSVPKSITAPISISGGTLSNGTAAVTITGTSITMTGGLLTAPLAGTGTLTIDSGSPATIQPNATTGSNAQTGNITVAASAIVRLVTPDAVEVSTAGNGRIIGNGDVTVSGTIRTRASITSSQKGQARYKSLTLNSGSRLEIGAA